MAGQSASTGLSQGSQTALYYARKKRSARWFAGLPTADPGVEGRVWNDNGKLKTSQG